MAAAAILKKIKKWSDFRPEEEIRQLRACALKNDSVGHNGLMGRYHVPQNVFLVC